jgi:hypothetical protein
MSAGVERLDRRLPWAVFALLLASYAYFYQAGGWNENSRMDLVRAMVEQRTLSIDAYHRNTGDKAKIGGRYYSDKAPGLSVAAIPAYLLVMPLKSRTSSHTFIVVASYIATVLTVGIATALLGVLLYRAGRRLGASPRGSVIGAVSYGLGTTAFPFATQLFSHQLAALLLFSAFFLLWGCRERYSDARSVGAGLLCAAAVVTEFPTAPAALILFFYHADAAQRARRLATFAAGMLGPLLLLAAYLTVAFGSPFTTGYALLADSGARGEMLGHGVFGITHPRIGVLVELLIGRFRGLLPYSPVLVLAIAGFAISFRTARRELWAALAVVAYYLLFVSSYAWWQGGSSFGSRHLLPMLPFFALPLARAADLRPKLTLAAFAVSLAAMTIVTSVQPKPGQKLENPFFRSIAPAFVRGQLALGNICPLLGTTGGRRHQPFLRQGFHDSFNLGMVLGGRGLPSLLPLLAIWLSAAFGFWHATRAPPPISVRNDQLD